MVEIFNFVNLIDDAFFVFKDKIEQLIHQKSNHIEVRILPTVDFSMMDQFFTLKGVKRSNLGYRNELFQINYEAALDFEGITMIENQSIAIQYIEQLQLILKKTGHFTSNDRTNILKQLHINEESLNRRHNGELIHDKIQHNQYLARQMAVNLLPSLVVFNFTRDNDYAILIERIEDFELIQDQLSTTDSIQEAVQQNQYLQLFN